MSKTALKKKIRQTKGDMDLSDDNSLIDTHRNVPKCKNGVYTLKNTDIVNPVEHMKIHDNYKARDTDFERLKSLVDERTKIMQARMKINNQLLAYKRQTDVPTVEMLSFLTDMVKTVQKKEDGKTKEIEKHMKQMDDPVINAMTSVKGIGPMTAAFCRVYLEIEKARHPSSFWKYTGLDKPSHSRYSKGESGGGNKRLRCQLYIMAGNQVKMRRLNTPYAIVYDQKKSRLENSLKIVTSRNTAGKQVEVAWKDTKPSHRHGAALRDVMKHFLADLHYVWSCIEGIEPSKPYAEVVLGRHKTIMPKERGWKW